MASCTAAPPGETDPVGPDSEPTDSVTIPAPPVTGINPCVGWPGGLNGPATYTRNGDDTVSFHGGTWVVPFTESPGQAISEVSFTIEAPTGVSAVIVELFSVPSESLLGQISLQPGGAGVRVNSAISLSPAYVASSGESFELVFVPLNATGDGYPTNDMKIDTVGHTESRTVTRSFYPKIVSGSWSGIGDLTIFDGYVQSTGINSQAFIEIPAEEGDTLTRLTVDAKGNGVTNCMYTVFYGVGMGSQSAIGGPNDNGRPSTWSTVPIFSSRQHVDAGGGLILFVQASGPGYSIGKMHATFTH
ncbi:MAG TPA: hypothetical protein VFZ00_11275 [Solirubrobacter sp.]|nr:hypothetical protein [Solirubrobacter sp.]